MVVVVVGRCSPGVAAEDAPVRVRLVPIPGSYEVPSGETRIDNKLDRGPYVGPS